MSIQSAIFSEIERIAAQHQKTLAPLSADTVLMNSGLDSLCFAVLVARLEDQLGVDPFSTSEDVEFSGDARRLRARLRKCREMTHRRCGAGWTAAWGRRGISAARRESVALADLIDGSGFGGRLGALRERSVSRRHRRPAHGGRGDDRVGRHRPPLVICPPDVPQDHLRAIVATAEVDAIVSDRDTPDPGAFGIPLHVGCSATIEPQAAQHDVQGRPAGETEWVLLTSGTTGAAQAGEPRRREPHRADQGRHRSLRSGAPSMIFAAMAGCRSSCARVRRRRLARPVERRRTGRGSPGPARRPRRDAPVRHAVPLVARSHGAGGADRSRRAMCACPVRSPTRPVLDNLRSVYPQAGIGHAYASTEAGVGFEVDDGLEGFPAHFVDAGNGDVDIKIADGVAAAALGANGIRIHRSRRARASRRGGVCRYRRHGGTPRGSLLFRRPQGWRSSMSAD